MKKTKEVLVTSFLAAAMLLSGCAAKKDQQKEISPRAVSIADKYFSGDDKSYEAWKDIDRSKVVAYVEGAEDSDYFNITFDEFFSEYMYYLVSYQIDDDMSDENKSACESYRDNIITYLTFERQYLYVGKNEYGISEDTLTEDQKNSIIASSETVRNDWASNFYTACSAELGESASEEDISALCDEVLRAILKKCGLSEDIFYRWELNRSLEELVIEEIVKDAVVTDDEVDQMLSDLIEEAKDKAANDPGTYEANLIYHSVFIPDGTRNSKHIFLPFTDTGSKDSVKQDSDAIKERLAKGESFDKICEEKDDEDTSAHLVLKNSTSVTKEYTDALYSLARPGDVSEPVITDNGIYFIQYVGDAAVSPDDTENVKGYIRSSLESQAKTNAQNKEYSKWLEKYKYTVDYDTLHIDKDTSILASMDTSEYK